MSTTQVYDRWHLSRPPEDTGETSEFAPCEHSTRNRTLYPAATHGKGKQWQVRYRDHDDRQRKEHFDRKADAQKRAAAIQADMDRGSYTDPHDAKKTLEAVTAEWLQAALHKPQTAENADKAFRIHINPLLGHRAVGSIKPYDIDLWVANRSKVLAASTLKITFGYLRAALQRAVRDGLIPRDPSQGVKLPAARKGEIHPLHPLVVDALVNGAPEHYAVSLLVAAATGLRQGEVWGLELEHIDFKRGEIRVRQQLVTPSAGKPYIGVPKTHESYRTVSVPLWVLEWVQRHLERYPLAPVVIWDRTDPRKPVERKANLVFLNKDRQPIRRSQWSRVWANIVKRANEQLKESGSELQVPKGATMHDLRHFYASLLIKHGESIKVVQRALGHAKPSITLDTYVHLWEAVEDTTRDAVTQGLAFMKSAPVVPSRLAVAA